MTSIAPQHNQLQQQQQQQQQTLNDTLRRYADRSSKTKRRRLNEDPIDRFVRLAPSILSVDMKETTMAATTTTRAMPIMKGDKTEDPAKEKIEKNETTITTAIESDKDDSGVEKEAKQEDNGGKLDKTETKQSCRWQTDIERYEKLFAQEREAIESIARARERIKKHQVDLWGVYQYGLRQISGLNDLGDAPDAILPGNF